MRVDQFELMLSVSARPVPHPYQPQCLITHLSLKQALQCLPFIIWELTEYLRSVLTKCQDLKF